MPRSVPYLIFKGECRQAMQFYRDCIGAELYVQGVAEPILPEALQHLVVHAELRKGKTLLLASDLGSEQPVIHGNAVVVFLECERESELRQYFDRLSDKGTVVSSPAADSGRALTGTLIDRYQIRWILYHDGAVDTTSH